MTRNAAMPGPLSDDQTSHALGPHRMCAYEDIVLIARCHCMGAAGVVHQRAVLILRVCFQRVC